MMDEFSNPRLTPIEPPASVRAALLDALHGRERYALFAAELSNAFGVTFADAHEALRAITDPNAWHSGNTPDSYVASVPQLKAAGAFFARLPAGFQIPTHEHAARELTLVLDGELLEDDAHRRGPGDLLEKLPGMRHSLEVTGDGECLVVFARGTTQ